MSEKDIPVMFCWETPWRPNEIEQLQANLGLHPGRTHDINRVMGFVLGQAIKTYRADPNRWISYSRNQNWYRDSGRRQYFPVATPYASARSAIDQLATTGAVEHRKSPRGNLGQQSRFRATPDLYRAYTERPVPLICEPKERPGSAFGVTPSITYSFVTDNPVTARLGPVSFMGVQHGGHNTEDYNSDDVEAMAGQVALDHASIHFGHFID